MGMFRPMIIRKTCASLIPLSFRPLLSSSLHDDHVKVQSHQFCTVAVDDKYKLFDQRFSQVLKSEIQSLKQYVPEKPDDFCMEIEDDPEDKQEKFIKLKSNIEKERVQVSMARKPINYKIGHGDKESSNNSCPTTVVPMLQLFVKVVKRDNTYMEIEVLASADEIILRNIKLPDSGCGTRIANPDKEMAPEVQRCFKDFLAIRGINRRNIDFLYEYMIHNSKVHDMLCLNQLHTFLNM